MRLRDLISEANGGKLSKREQQASAGLHTYSGKSNDYDQYKLMSVVACADGVTNLNVDGDSWIGRKKSAHPYTDLEAEMLKQSYKSVGLKYDDLNRGDNDSRELDSTNKTSPVAKKKRNRYGV